MVGSAERGASSARQAGSGEAVIPAIPKHGWAARASVWTSVRILLVALLLAPLPGLRAGAEGLAIGLSPTALPALDIEVGRAEILRLARPPGTVVVGDERIVAVNLVSDRILVLSGLAPGETNVIVLGERGEAMTRFLLRVVRAGRVLTVRRGGASQAYRCEISCRPIDAAPIAPVAAEGGLPRIPSAGPPAAPGDPGTVEPVPSRPVPSEPATAVPTPADPAIIPSV